MDDVVATSHRGEQRVPVVAHVELLGGVAGEALVDGDELAVGCRVVSTAPQWETLVQHVRAVGHLAVPRVLGERRARRQALAAGATVQPPCSPMQTPTQDIVQQ